MFAATKCCMGIVLVSLAVIWTEPSKAQNPDSVIYYYDFEAGQGLWTITNGLWSVERDTTLPIAVQRSGRMAGVVLGGSLPASSFDTYLVSPAITLPSIDTTAELRLKFTHWHDFNGWVVGSATIREVLGGGNFGPWETVSVDYGAPINTNYWKDASIIISKFSGKRINIGFRAYGWCHWAGCGNGAPGGRGWRVDNVSIVKSRIDLNILPVGWDFDQDWGSVGDANRWWDAHDLIKVGRDTTTISPSQPFVAGTYLNRVAVPVGAYTVRFVSPSIIVPRVDSTQDIIVRFRYLLNTNGWTSAGVGVAIDSGANRWGPWNDSIASLTTSTNWIRISRYIPARYGGKRIRLSFIFSGWCHWAGCGNGGPGGKGYYIDDVDVFVSGQTPRVPLLVTPVSDITSLLPTFRWRLAAAAFRYRLQLATDSLFAAVQLDSMNIENLALVQPRPLVNGQRYFWRAKAINDWDSSAWSPASRFRPFLTAVGVTAAIPNSFSLSQNYPNPFNPATTIRFTIGGVEGSLSSHVKLTVFDLLGREVRTLVNEELNSGTYETTFDGDGLASGIYLYRLQARPTDGRQAGSFVETKKLILLR